MNAETLSMMKDLRRVLTDELFGEWIQRREPGASCGQRGYCPIEFYIAEKLPYATVSRILYSPTVCYIVYSLDRVEESAILRCGDYNEEVPFELPPLLSALPQAVDIVFAPKRPINNWTDIRKEDMQFIWSELQKDPNVTMDRLSELRDSYPGNYVGGIAYAQPITY